jgi:hypothetical protein
VPQKPSIRRQELLAQLSSIPGFEGIDTVCDQDAVCDRSVAEQIDWVLERTNSRLRPAITTLVRAGQRSGLNAQSCRTALIELLGVVYGGPVNHDAMVANAQWCACLAANDTRAATRDAARRVMTEMFERGTFDPDADSSHDRLFMWAVDEDLVSSRRVWDRELMLHCCCRLATSARHDGSVTWSLFWLDRADRTMATLWDPDPHYAVRINGNRALTLALAGERDRAVALATEFVHKAAAIGADRWEQCLRSLVTRLNEPD